MKPEASRRHANSGRSRPLFLYEAATTELSGRTEQPLRITKLTSIIALGLAATAIAGCGGSAPQKPAAQDPVASQRPLQASNASNLDIGRSPAQQNDKGKQPKVSRGARIQRGHATPDQADHDGVPITNTNPCKLVSVHEANTMTGGAIAGSRLAPLGPTCVFSLDHRKANITLNVEASNFSEVTRPMVKREQLEIRGHKAYCGQLGSPMLYVQLSGGRVLHVSAPCLIAQRFAQTALSHLAA